MKKFWLISVVFVLANVLVACGGESKKTVSPTQNPRDSIETSIARERAIQTVAPTATSTKEKQTIDVSGKGCPPEGTYKVTSTDKTEAVINIFCSTRTSTPYSSWYPSNSLKFTSLTIRPYLKTSVELAEFKIDFLDCAGCPRQFSGLVLLEKNPLGEWQQFSEQGSFQVGETEASKTVVAERTSQAALNTAAMVVIDFPIRDLKLNFYHSLYLNPVLSGKVDSIQILCQFDDGTTMKFTSGDIYWSEDVFMNAPDYRPSTLMFYPTGQLQGVDIHVKILAYKFSVDPGYTSPDWIFFK